MILNNNPEKDYIIPFVENNLPTQNKYMKLRCFLHHSPDFSLFSMPSYKANKPFVVNLIINKL